MKNKLLFATPFLVAAVLAAVGFQFGAKAVLECIVLSLVVAWLTFAGCILVAIFGD